MSISPCVVVGIDGSRSAVDAAVWAVEEAVSRDTPLRLVYAIDPADNGSDHEDAARALATAEIAIRQAFTAVQASEQPVRIELEVVQDKPIHALVAASQSAAMVCIGAVGITHAGQGVGSTAAAVAKAAHCPVAIVRSAASTSRVGILVEFDGTPNSSAVLQIGVDEARLRDVKRCVTMTWQSRLSNMYDATAVGDRNHLAHAQPDRRITRWHRRYPELEIQTIATDTNTLDYLSTHRDSVQLVIVGAERSGGIGELADPPGLAVLADADCSLLTCDRRQRL